LLNGKFGYDLILIAAGHSKPEYSRGDSLEALTMTTDFLHCFVLDGRGGRETLDAAGLAAWQPEHGILWLHIDVNNEASRHWLTHDSGLPGTIADALLADETRPRSHISEDGGLVVLRGVNTNPGDDPEDMVSVRIWIETNRIISSSRRRLLSLQDVQGTFDGGKGPVSPGSFLAALIGLLANRIGDFVDTIEDRIGDIEDDGSSDDAVATRQSITGLRRQLAAVRRFIAPQRDALDRLYRQPGALFTDSEANELREEADRFTRYLEDIDLARERVVVLQEELLARVAQEQNTRMYVLSVVAAIFLPLTFVTGLLGMNVGGLPGLEYRHGFAVSIVIMVASAAVLLAFFRWKKWL
jgi:zinc transporter